PAPQSRARTGAPPRSPRRVRARPRPCPRRESSCECFFQKLRDHRVRVEVLLRDLTGRSRMPVVVGCDGLGTGNRLLERAEGEEPLVGGNRLAESRVLDERRLAGGQIAGRPVAEPARVRLDVDALGNRELGRRTLNVAPKRVWI